MSRIDLPEEKKVGHLTLLRTPRALSPREFNALAFSERLAMVRSVEGRRKYDLLIEAADAERLVRFLPAQEVYLLIKELGKEEAPEVLALASTAQVTTFLDLDCWQRDRLDERKVLEWLALLLEAGEEKALATALELDFELHVMLLKKILTVARGPEDYLDDDARQEAVQRFGGYEFDFRESEGAKLGTLWLDLIFRHEPEFYPRLIEAVRWEQESLLEEEVFHFRSGRLQDQGFPDPAEAGSVYAWLDPSAFDPEGSRKRGIVPGEATEAPGFVLSAAAPRGLLAEVLAEGIDGETAWELTFLLNQVMSADGVDVGEPQQVRESMEEVYRYLNIALEHLAGTDVDRGAALLREVYLQSLFRLGFSLTLELQRKARSLDRSSIGPYLDGGFRTFLDALLQRKPRFYQGVEDPLRTGERPFGGAREVHRAEEALESLEVQRRLFEEAFPFRLTAPETLELEECFPEEAADLTLSAFFLTALANRILGREFTPEPVPRADLAGLHAAICREGDVRADLREETVRWLEELAPGGGDFAGYCLNVWRDNFCALTSGELDPRFLRGLIVRNGGAKR